MESQGWCMVFGSRSLRGVLRAWQKLTTNQSGLSLTQRRKQVRGGGQSAGGSVGDDSIQEGNAWIFGDEKHNFHTEYVLRLDPSMHTYYTVVVHTVVYAQQSVRFHHVCRTVRTLCTVCSRFTSNAQGSTTTQSKNKRRQSLRPSQHPDQHVPPQQY